MHAQICTLYGNPLQSCVPFDELNLYTKKRVQKSTSEVKLSRKSRLKTRTIELISRARIKAWYNYICSHSKKHSSPIKNSLHNGDFAISLKSIQNFVIRSPKT